MVKKIQHSICKLKSLFYSNKATILFSINIFSSSSELKQLRRINNRALLSKAPDLSGLLVEWEKQTQLKPNNHCTIFSQSLSLIFAYENNESFTDLAISLNWFIVKLIFSWTGKNARAFFTYNLGKIFPTSIKNAYSLAIDYLMHNQYSTKTMW